MVISKIKIVGYEIDVLFTGRKYIFHHNFYGVIGVACRKDYGGDDEHTFTIKAGTEDTVGGSINRNSIITAMKRYISRKESYSVSNETFFEDSGETLHCDLQIKVIDFKPRQ